MDISGTPTQQQGGKMYKKQLKLQKILCFLAIASSVVIFLYALGIMTDLYDTLYSTMKNPANLSETDVPGSIVYYNMQAFNSYFLRESIVLILIACLLFLTNTHVRRRYYIGNYISVAIIAIANIYVAIEAHGYIEAFKERFLRVDFNALKEHAEMWKTAYSESTFWFDIHYVVFAFSVLVAVALVASTIWKVRLMKEEARLIAVGKEKTA
jgi:hypothetical protein